MLRLAQNQLPHDHSSIHPTLRSGIAPFHASLWARYNRIPPLRRGYLAQFHCQVAYPHWQMIFPHWQVAKFHGDPPIGNWMMPILRSQVSIRQCQMAMEDWQVSLQLCHPSIGNWGLTYPHWRLALPDCQLDSENKIAAFEAVGDGRVRRGNEDRPGMKAAVDSSAPPLSCGNTTMRDYIWIGTRLPV
jgi:hypothetical protein